MKTEEEKTDPVVKAFRALQDTYFVGGWDIYTGDFAGYGPFKYKGGLIRMKFYQERLSAVVYLGNFPKSYVIELLESLSSG